MRAHQNGSLIFIMHANGALMDAEAVKDPARDEIRAMENVACIMHTRMFIYQLTRVRPIWS